MDKDLYGLLTSLFSSQVVQVEILPVEEYLYSHEDAALAVSQKALIACVCRAREVFFESEDISAARYDASTVLLLWDPNHGSAVNLRRRYVSNRGIVQQECNFLASMLTSPLPKHPKSSTLWAYRRWLGSVGLCSDLRIEVEVVLRAAEQHPRNYYAWQYARHLAWKSSGIEQIKSWCLMHPRDISGWCFLVWLLRRNACRETQAQVRSEVEGFRQRLNWHGTSLDWFMFAVEHDCIQT